MIRKFRKKPVVIEAVQWTGSNFGEIASLVGKGCAIVGGALFIDTLENRNLEADEGDWIIKGVNGEFYPCKPDIFEKTYEVA